MKLGEIRIKAEYILSICYRKRLYKSVNMKGTCHTQDQSFSTLKLCVCVYDMIDYNNIVFMFKAHNSLLPDRLLCYFKRVCDSHNHNTHDKNNNYKIKYSRMAQKAACISIKGPKLWNQLHPDLKTCRTVYQFKSHYKRLLLLLDYY